MVSFRSSFRCSASSELTAVAAPSSSSLTFRHVTSLLFASRSHVVCSPARVAQSNLAENFIFESTRLFCSNEGEKVEECSCSFKYLDALNVTEEFVVNVDRVVETMNNVSNGEFLRGGESELSLEWFEFGWLKAKGYYSLEAFVVNRIELALRFAWLNCNSGKRRGVKLKDKLRGAGIAANVVWRKKGCVDWWANLDDSTRKKVLTTIMGKATKLC